MPWQLLWILGAGGAFLAIRAVSRRSQREAAGIASGLSPVGDLSHLPAALQKMALWALADGGFERRVLHGVVNRSGAQIDVTAFDLETLRERRGEWAYLPVEPPFRIGGVVSVVACELDRTFPHILIKHAGHGDQMKDDDLLERLGNLAKQVRDRMWLARSFAAELPPTLPAAPIAVDLPAQWRAYSLDPERVAALAAAGLRDTLERAARRDLVIEMLDSLVVVYPAAREVVGPDALADLSTTALAIVDGIRTSAVTPRGVTP